MASSLITFLCSIIPFFLYLCTECSYEYVFRNLMHLSQHHNQYGQIACDLF